MLDYTLPPRSLLLEISIGWKDSRRWAGRLDTDSIRLANSDFEG